MGPKIKIQGNRQRRRHAKSEQPAAQIFQTPVPPDQNQSDRRQQPQQDSADDDPAEITPEQARAVARRLNRGVGPRIIKGPKLERHRTCPRARATGSTSPGARAWTIRKPPRSRRGEPAFPFARKILLNANDKPAHAAMMAACCFIRTAVPKSAPLAASAASFLFAGRATSNTSRP